MRACVCVCRGTHILSCILWEHKRPASPCTVLFPMAFHVPCPTLCREDGELLHVADRSGVSHCLTGRVETTMILSGRSEESLDPALCSSEQILPAARPQLAPKCSVLTSLCHRHSLSLGRKNNASDCLGVFCCFLFSVL